MDEFVPGFSDVMPDVQRYLAMPKDVVRERCDYQWPQPGRKLQIELFSYEDNLTKFFLDIIENKRTSTVIVSAQTERKSTIQTRVSSRPYLRIDMADNQSALLHRNPDVTLIEGNHVHLDIVGYGWGFAWPLMEQRVVVPAEDAYCLEGMFESLLELNNVTRSLKFDYSLGV